MQWNGIHYAQAASLSPDQQSTRRVSVQAGYYFKKCHIFHYKLIEQNAEVGLAADLKCRICCPSPVLTLKLSDFEIEFLCTLWSIKHVFFFYSAGTSTGLILVSSWWLVVFWERVACFLWLTCFYSDVQVMEWFLSSSVNKIASVDTDYQQRLLWVVCFPAEVILVLTWYTQREALGWLTVWEVWFVNFRWKGCVDFSPAPLAFLGLKFLTNFTDESLGACGIFGN